MKRTPVCNFCARPVDEVDLIFEGQLGGMPPAICSDCVETFWMVVDLHRKHPDKTDRMIASINAEYEARKRAS